jgi:Fe2+ or Zn2+ uptake regulation protein
MAKNNPAGEGSIDVLRAMLRKSGYKATGPRLSILALFKETKHPMSAQEILLALPRSAHVDQATVYRTLKTLKAKSLVKPIDLRHNHAHYELANLEEHHHLICLRCGRIEDVDRCGVETLQTTVLKNSKHFAQIKEHTLEFYGLCKTCAKGSLEPKRAIL